MPSRLAVIVIDAVRPHRIADFWCSVLGWQIIDQDAGLITIAAADRSWPMIDVAPVPESKIIKNRLHFDLRADGVSTAEELKRLLQLGHDALTSANLPMRAGSCLPTLKAMSSACWRGLFKKLSSRTEPR